MLSVAPQTSGLALGAPAGLLPPVWARAALVACMVAAGLAGAVAGGSPAVADTELTRLLRAMAALKALMAAGVAAGVLWRLGAGIAPWRLLAYAGACGAMAAGPGLIWTMGHVGMGAALLHGGLLASLLLLWRDPAAGKLLAAAVTRRRAQT